MRKFSLSTIHILIAVIAIVFGVSKLNGQERPEMIPYRLVPSDPHPDYLLEIEIEIIQPYTVESLISVHRQETMNIIYERIEFETINPDGRNQIFKIDGKLYYLIRIPYTGVQW
tara:strand:+ start:2758 stop:3099 length:342 start_codon:yes stop_codon:yes gene_type:complete